MDTHSASKPEDVVSTEIGRTSPAPGVVEDLSKAQARRLVWKTDLVVTPLAVLAMTLAFLDKVRLQLTERAIQNCYLHLPSERLGIRCRLRNPGRCQFKGPRLQLAQQHFLLWLPGHGVSQPLAHDKGSNWKVHWCVFDLVGSFALLPGPVPQLCGLGHDSFLARCFRGCCTPVHDAPQLHVVPQRRAAATHCVLVQHICWSFRRNLVLCNWTDQRISTNLEGRQTGRRHAACSDGLTETVHLHHLRSCHRPGRRVDLLRPPRLAIQGLVLQ